ncbi:MAG: multicopper oxidase domain-containing protein [Burkholderiales bacterium]|nr:multicopper oxidase domain-containing protein [Burkholderiales bacterium]
MSQPSDTQSSASQTVALGRRRFLGWCASAAVPMVAGSVGVTLTACISDGSNDTNTPFAGLSRVDNPGTLNLSVQQRRVQWVPGRTPATDNAWVYVPQGTASGTVLPNHLGPIINVRRDSACTIVWTNTVGEAATRPGKLSTPPVNSPLTQDICGNVQTQSEVSLVTHLHGARVQGSSDGWPLAPIGFAGNPYGFPTSQTYTYPNQQRSAMLWYHDHALDHTGRHVYAGLAGLYFIRDAADDAVLGLIGGADMEFPLVIQDRILASDGINVDYAAGMPTTDPLTRPEFLGTSLFVNGHPSTVASIGRRTWRVRLLNASNARTYALALCNPAAIEARAGQVWHNQCVRVIGADGGLLARSVPLGASDVIVIAPGQRRDLLVDLSTLPVNVNALRWVNLNLLATLSTNDTTPEAIYTTFTDSVLAPTSTNYSAADAGLYAALDGPVTDVMRLTLEAVSRPVAGQAGTVLSPTTAAIDAVLANAASDDDFIWDGNRFNPMPNAVFGPNRMVLLVSNTEGHAATDAVNGISGFGDVQIFEMGAAGTDWQIPFAVDLATGAAPVAGGPAAPQGYKLSRRSFFASEVNLDVTAAKRYPDLHSATISCKPGTYERWYVANIGNTQPLVANENLPDMHPFHIHLVNGVVTRRWDLDPTTGTFVLADSRAPDIDGVARQDTVLIPSNQIIELVVYFPPGYSGQYAYHCHLLEHEDMCMMSHFEVAAA